MRLFGDLLKTDSFRTLCFIAVLATLSASASAQCREPKPPVFPEFDASDLSVMEVADKRLQLYIDSAEEYLECLGEEERKGKMDGILGRIKDVTARYNTLANHYRKSRAEKLFSNSPE